MRLVMDLVQRAAAGRCGMLICGERGTGREMIARAIHAHGTNRNAPFVKVDCSGPTPEDIEIQLFGIRQRRAPAAARPSGAASKRISRNSRLAEAAGGILFLENVDGAARARSGEARAGPARPRSVRRSGPRDRCRSTSGPWRRSTAPSSPPRRRPDAHGPARAIVADSRGGAGAPAAARRHPGPGHPFPEGNLPHQRQGR